MFRSARIKLTLWYVLITLTVSIVFSVALFFVLHRELERGIRRYELRRQFFNLPQAPPYGLENFDTSNIEKIIALRLVYVNLIVLAMAALAGYFLAGQVLKPIKDMVDDQNRFITAASHELRTPLTAMETAIEVNLRDSKLTLAQARDVLSGNLEDVFRMKKLSNNLLTLVRLKEVDTAIKKQAVSLEKVIKEVVRNVSSLSKKKHINIKTKLVNVKVLGYEDRLVELFIIFLDNAIKYSHSKSVIEIVAQKKDKWAQVEIIDQGMGINQVDLPHIFERFYRADKSRENSGGYGIGLSIAREIIDLHQGKVEVKSEIKKGTVFTIKLPLTV